MTSNFMISIKFLYFMSFDLIDLERSSRFIAQNTIAQIKGTFDLVFIKDLDQSFILFDAIVIAQGKCLLVSTGEQQCIETFAHDLPPFY